MRQTLFRFSAVIISLFLTSLISLIFTNDVGAIAKQSTLTMNFQTNVLELEIIPSLGGTFASSDTASISVNTDNFTGYSLSILTSDSTSLVNSNNDEVQSISSSIDETTFSTSSAYNNKWGYKPSQYVTTNNNVDTVVQNSNYLPAPSSSGVLLAKTSAANVTSDNYTLSFGARVDTTLPAGTYSTTYVLAAVANSIVYNITYDANATGTVNNMPSPNPQVVNIDGGTPVAQSSTTLSSAEPTLTDKIFGGWCDVATTVNSINGNYECAGTTYQPGDEYGIDQTSDGANIRLYAIWLVDLFPVVWSQMGACEFHGATNGNITGSECADYHTVKFIDTGIPLYNNTNYLKDYEIHMTIDHYDPNEQVNNQSGDNSQQTFVNDKLGTSAADGKAPGLVVRRSGTAIQFNSKLNDSQEAKTNAANRTHEFSVYRINNVIYYSVNSGPLIELQDITGFSQQFELNTWIGAYPSDNCTGSPTPCTNAKRIPEATFSNMYIKLGDFDESNLHQVIFDENYGSSPETTTYLVMDGNSVGTLPTATRSGWTFGGWWTAASGGTRITTSYVPTTNERFYAHWTQDYTITFDPQNNTSMSTASVAAGSQLGSAYPSPDPTYTDHVFQGWFTQSSGGTQISSSTVPSGNTTYYAQWKGTVDLATVASNTISMTTNDTATVTVSNAADLEGFTFSSSDTNVATIDASTGVIAPLSAGTTTISITGASSTLTNQIVTVTVTQPVVQYTITFNPNNNNETSPWNETIDAGDDLSDVYPATNPTYTNHLFQGWYTAASGGTLVTSNTEPSGSTTYYAQWKGTVALATFSSNSIVVQEGNTATISVTNSADIEGFGFASLDSTVATVDSSTGVVTGVAAGTTSIRMTGATSLTYVDIPVTVTALPTYTVYFNPHNNTANSSATVVAGQQIGSNNIPADPTNTDPEMIFMGWFTAASGGTEIDGTTVPTADGETYHAQYKKIVCKLAASGTLHTATRASDSVPLTYGYIADNPTPAAGDAYNCDVDYDDTYSAANERFYYMGQDSNNNAVLVAWNSYYSGSWAPGVSGSSGDTIYSYSNALLQLPANTSGAWDNPGLIEQETGKAARFTTRAEVASACNMTLSGITATGALEACDYFMEHSAYDDNGRSALWLMEEGSTLYRIHSGNGNRHVATASNTSSSMVRPTIVVPYRLIEKFTPLDVTNAVIANNDLTVPVGGNITIQVSNSASLEAYTFSSADSTIATVDSSTGVVTGVSAGTVNIIMTGTTSGLTKTLEVDVLSSLPDYTVTFNTNGGSLDDGASSTRTVTDGDEVGALPTASKTNHRFFGWYKDNGTFYEEVYEDEVIEDDITLYAKWVEDTSGLPIVWSEINACEFNGNAVISGDYCTQNKTKKMVDTGIALFDTTNYQKDFEIGFTVVEYETASQTQTQATLVNSKYENSGLNYPGFVMRRTGDNFQLTSKWSSGTPSDATFVAENLKTVKIVRQNGVLKRSFNGGTLTTYYDTSSNTHRFDTRVWFGAAATSDNETPQRWLVGTLTDMYIRLGTNTTYNVELNPNGGSLPSGTQSEYTINAGSPVGALPTPTAPSASYSFGGWYDGNTLVSDGTQYIPTGDITLVAEWVYNSSDTPVVFDVSNDATRGYKTIINQWVQSPINITTFNKNATINNSTWGDTNELSEAQFWTALKNNFESNQCLKPSYGDAATTTPNPTAWANGTVDCAKPDAYDTLLGEAVNVYLYNNQTLGAQVTYANSSDGVIHNLIPGNTYKWVKDGDSTVYGYVTVTSNGSDHGTRWVDAGQIRNVRDLGGLPADTDDDGTIDAYVDYGRLFRGEKLWTAPATNLTNLGITKEYDVGDPAEYSGNTKLSSYQNDQVIHYNFDYNSGDENNATSNYMRAWTAVTDIMEDIVSENNPQNIYFHCRVGADRTGTVAYLLEGLLGVPDEERYQEYSLTHLSGLFDRTRYYKQKSNTNNLKFVFMMGYVQTTQNIIDWYMHNPSADPDLIDDFRAAMTVPIQ